MYRCKRTTYWLYFVVLGLTLLIAPNQALPASPNPSAPPLRVVTDNNYPPYVFNDAEGHPEGYVVDLWKLWQQKTGVPVEFNAMQWSEAQRAMHEGRADVIDMIFRTPVREQLYDFSQPYATLPVDIFVDASIHGVKSAKDLAGFTIGVERGDACVDKLSSLGITSVAAYANYQEIFTAAKAGDIKIFCMDEAPANYYLYLFRDNLRFSRAFQLYEGEFHWAVTKGDKANFALVNRGMALITDQERETLRKKWFSHPVEILPYAQWFLFGAAATLVVLAVAGLWIGLLRRSVQARTAELQQTNLILREERARLRTIVDSSPDGIALKNREGVYLDCNASAQILLGIPRDQIIGKNNAQLITDPILVDLAQKHDELVINNKMPTLYEEAITSASGKRRLLEVTKVPIFDESRQVDGVLLVFRDITERREAERELRIASVAFQSHDGLMIVNAQQVIERVNAAFTRITGFPTEEAIGRTPSILQSGLHPPSFYEAMWSALQQTDHWQGEVINRHRDGKLYTARLSITAVKDLDGEVVHFIGDIHDITAEKLAREQAAHLKHYDPLTDLPNRSLLEECIQRALVAGEERHEYGALTLLDIDFFNKVNDSLGHAFGDKILVEIAHRIRSVAGEGDTVARFSGDTFVLLTENLGPDRHTAARRAMDTAEAVRLAIEAPIMIDGHKMVTTASVGSTIFLGHAVSHDILLRQAELAMYKAKTGGRNLVHFFEDAMQQEIDKLRWLEVELREAVAQGQFTLHYQLQVDALLRPIGAEALLRWNHPTRGLVLPGEFITLAEQTGLIESIGHWVLATACDQLAQWAHDKALRQLTISINVSPRQFKAKAFVDDVVSEIRRSGAPIDRLKLEVTESLAIDSFDESINKLHTLHQFGCKISLDDFGTGNSSLTYLTRLPLNQLKIDKSFVDKLPDSASDSLVAQTIIAMGQGLGLDVIAEGVEHPEQQACLAAMGCHAFQGYLFGRPLPSQAFEQVVREWANREGT